MKPVGPYVFCRADVDQKKHHQISGTDIDLYIETKFNNNFRERNPNYAEVVYVSGADHFFDWDKHRQDQTLKPGDFICVQHFQLFNDRNESQEVEINGEKLFKVDLREVYFKVEDGVPVMFASNTLCEPIELETVTEGGILIPETAQENYIKDQKRAVVRFVPEKHEGVNVGDEIIFVNFADYELEFNGKKYLKINLDEILARIK